MVAGGTALPTGLLAMTVLGPHSLSSMPSASCSAWHSNHSMPDIGQPVYAPGFVIATSGTSIADSVQVVLQVLDDADNEVVKMLTISVINSVPGVMTSAQVGQAGPVCRTPSSMMCAMAVYDWGCNWPRCNRCITGRGYSE